MYLPFYYCISTYIHSANGGYLPENVQIIPVMRGSDVTSPEQTIIVEEIPEAGHALQQNTVYFKLFFKKSPGAVLDRLLVRKKN